MLTAKRNIFFLLCLILQFFICNIYVYAIDTGTRIFDPRYRTLKTSVADDFMAVPVINSDRHAPIVINFDLLGDDAEQLRYRVIHCNADWQPSALVESEYVTGFNDVDIEDYAYSSNTFVHYVNYRIEVPNEEMEFPSSGNYLLQVYRRDDPDDIVLQTRFRVSEDSASIGGKVTANTAYGIRTEWQQLDLEADVSGLDLNNPYTDLILVIEQNNRPATARYITTPQRVLNKKVSYEHIPQLIFPASNEYRRFESINVLSPGMNTDSIRFGEANYHFYLKEDRPRASSHYDYDSTQKGRFMIREYNATDSDLGADYVTVHFFLKSPELRGEEIYVDGEFTNGILDSSNRMTYDHDRRGYLVEIPLKQGSYNYQYVTGDKSDPAPVEGNHFETRNEYDIYLYLRKPGSRGDRLIGVVAFSPDF